MFDLKSFSSSVIGLAYVGSVCSKYKYSIVEDHGGFFNIFVSSRTFLNRLKDLEFHYIFCISKTIAHELGHM